MAASPDAFTLSRIPAGGLVKDGCSVTEVVDDDIEADDDDGNNVGLYAHVCMHVCMCI